MNCICFSGFAQTAESWELTTPQSGNKTYIARENITLKSGFTYTATSGNVFNARIDQTLLFPPTGNTYANETGTIVGSATQGAMVGNLSGGMDVSPSGAATYTIPIEVPPGIQGMHPNISLVYNSQSGNGIAGMCWNLGGLSMISKVPKNYYYDNDKSGIIWDQTSPLTLDGQRLIKIQDWGTDSIEYRTESGIDKIVGYSIGNSGPDIIKVYTQDGRILEYGDVEYIGTNDMFSFSFGTFPIKINFAHGILQHTILGLGWLLCKVTDTNGNFIKYTYTATEWKIGSGHYYGDNRISTIEYGNDNIKVASVHFQYKNKTSSFVQYIGGIETKNQLILDNIEIKGINDELQEKYQLTYEVVDSNDFLTQIKRINAAGEFIHPLKFEWSPMTTYNYTHTSNVIFEVTPTITNLTNANFYPVAFGDFDGDNLTDVIIKYRKNNDAVWVAYKNQGNNTYLYKGQFSWDYNYENTFLFLDSDNDGKAELYVGRSRKEGSVYGYYLDCYRYQNNTLQSYPAGNKRIPIDATVYNDNNVRKQLNVISGDFSGDGETQFILFKNDNKMVSQLGLSALNLNTFGGNSSSKIFMSDVNANGQTEIAYRSGGTTTFYEYKKASGAFASIYSTTVIAHSDAVYTGDFNGDGNTDIITKKGVSPYSWRYFISTGSGLQEQTISSVISPSVNGIHILDVNQDGKSDILLTSLNSSSSSIYTLKLLISDGNGFISKILNSSFSSLYKSRDVSSNFQNGHSKDLFLYGFYGILFASTYAEQPEIISLNKNILFNKIIKITDSFNQESTISYKDYKSPYNTKLAQSAEDNYPVKNIGTSLFPDFEVINAIQTTNVNTTFIFDKPYVHKQAKGFLGFDNIQTNDNINSIVTETKYKLNNNFYFLYPFKTTVKTTGGATISETVSSYSVIDKTNKKYFLRLDSVVSTDVLKEITAKTVYSSYDSERNPGTIKTDFGNGITSTKSLSYIKKGSQFFNKISYQKITQSAPGESNYVRDEYFYYDNNGNLTLHTLDSLNANKVQTFYGNYDKYGNPRKITTIANNIARSQTLTYSSSGRFVKTKKNDQLNDSIIYNYNESKGLLTSEVTRLGTISYQYDNWGRLTLTTYPTGIKTANALQWAGNQSGKPSGAKYYSYTETSGQPPVIVWHDALGREIRTESYGLNKNKIWVDTEYNSKGQLYRISEPYFATDTKTWAATRTYDSYRRIQSVATPMGNTIYTYSFLTNTVSSPTETIATTANAAGWLVSQTTNGKKVDFTHYASGLVKSATPIGGKVLTMEYDLQGNRTKLTDPDAGIITSEYDGWGQLASESQAVHSTSSTITTVYNYLPSGLLNYKSRNDTITNYGYDNLYRLKWISIAEKHARSFVYDQWDRIIQSNDTTAGNKVLVSKTEYDALGRVYKETYSGGYSVYNSYDSYGYLTQVKDNKNNAIWQAKESNARGQLTKTQSGSNETVFGFDSRGFPTSIVTPGITNLVYIFNNKGNLVSRSDGTAVYKDSLVYDSMNRLTNWNIYKNAVKQQENSLSYNSTTGNIQTKSDLDNLTMNYRADGKPHALTSISGMPDLISSNQTIEYTDFKKVKKITDSGNILNISYGVDEQRIKTVLTKNNTSLTRYYLVNYEEEIANNSSDVRKINYICGGNGLAAIYVQHSSPGSDTLYYAHTDYQGSLSALSLPDGTVAERYAYDPWGNRRNPTDWSQADTRTVFILNRGYTMHEHLDEFKLINMNGRVYDPVTAQFFSPDPYLQAPGDWLNYNRYSYCLNNPFKYTDPSGEFLGIALRGITFLGDYFSNFINGNSNSVGKSWNHSGNVVSAFGSCAQIPIYQDNNTFISAGLDPLALGISANITHTAGDNTSSIGVGFSALGGFYANGGMSQKIGDWNIGAGIGAGNNYWGLNASATYQGVGGGYGKTYYGSAMGPDGLSNAQTVGSVSVLWRGGSFTLQNDVKHLGDGKDRWRTNAWELSFGDISFGSYIYTNDGQLASNGETDDSCWSPIWGKNKRKSAWIYGESFSAPMWFGYRVGNQISRIGYSFPGSQDLQQNGIHTNTSFGAQNYYLKYDNFRSGIYINSGYYSPFSLWGH
jgi:RHS repeat-associated protein